MIAVIQFIKGIDETTIPLIKLTRSRDGSTGTATFIFKNANILELDPKSGNEAEVTGMYLIDEEGELITKDVNVQFSNGKPKTIQALYIIKNPESWDRFIRFMERYAKNNDLTFTKA
ncbi:unnamed protein product [Discosporangium mesarthrocarpum]